MAGKPGPANSGCFIVLILVDQPIFKNDHEELTYEWARKLPSVSTVIGETRSHLKQCDWKLFLDDGRMAQIECKAPTKIVKFAFQDIEGWEGSVRDSSEGSHEGRWLYKQIKEAADQLDPHRGPTMLMIPSCKGGMLFDDFVVMQALIGLVGVTLPTRSPIHHVESFGSCRPSNNRNLSAIGIIRWDFPHDQHELIDRILEGNQPIGYSVPQCIPVVDIFKNPHAIVEWPDALRTKSDQVYVLTGNESDNWRRE